MNLKKYFIIFILQLKFLIESKERANLFNELKIAEVSEAAKKKVRSAAETSNSDLKLLELTNVLVSAHQVALEEVCLY